jgi:hypothetical protein
MGFLSGGVSAVLFDARWPTQFDGLEMERLSANAAEPAVFGADGVAAGWTAGRHRRDTNFANERNMRGDFLTFDFRVTKDRLPGDLLREYAAELMAEMVAGNDGRPLNRKQKREAREQALERLEGESQDGRFRRHTTVPVVWDRQAGRVWFGAGNVSAVDRFLLLFAKTFGVDLRPVTPASLAGDDLKGLATEFVPGVTPAEFLWSPDVERPVHLGNEFALWLLWRMEAGDSSGEVAGMGAMAARTLTLECPRGQTGRETVSHESPIRLPEVRRALQSGKVPRSLGLTLVDKSEQYEITLHADRWAFSGCRLPQPGDDQPADVAQKELARLEGVRAMFQTVETLFQFFCQFRRDPVEWETEVRELRQWLGVNG